MASAAGAGELEAVGDVAVAPAEPHAVAAKLIPTINAKPAENCRARILVM